MFVLCRGVCTGVVEMACNSHGIGDVKEIARLS
jgi:hypothetical protein